MEICRIQYITTSHLNTVYGSCKASTRKIFEAFNKNRREVFPHTVVYHSSAASSIVSEAAKNIWAKTERELMMPNVALWLFISSVCGDRDECTVRQDY